MLMKKGYDDREFERKNSDGHFAVQLNRTGFLETANLAKLKSKNSMILTEPNEHGYFLRGKK